MQESAFRAYQPGPAPLSLVPRAGEHPPDDLLVAVYADPSPRSKTPAGQVAGVIRRRGWAGNLRLVLLGSGGR